MNDLTITILKASSQPYKDKTTGENKYFNEVTALDSNGDLIEMSCTKELVDYILKNKDTILKKTISVEAKPKGFELVKLFV